MFEVRVVLLLFACVVDFGLASYSLSDDWLKDPESPGLGMHPGPLVSPTQGALWPKPQMQFFYNGVFGVDPINFKFEVIGHTCDIVTDAISRYERILKTNRRKIMKYIRIKKRAGMISNEISERDVIGDLTSLSIQLSSPCEDRPYLNMDEQYELRVNSPDFVGKAQLAAESVWGIIRGLESFVQLLYSDGLSSKVYVNSTLVVDYPRFPHRGLHVDTARHYIPVKTLLSILDGMAANKFNVFHWHIVDDQSFPYQSQVWPLLSEQGAYSPLHVFTPEDVALVIETARLRGIRVIPEFDTPGHTRSWGIGYPDLLTTCYDSMGQPDGSLGPMNPISNYTIEFMGELLKELKQVFPDQFLHLGGDEVPFECWLSNPALLKFMDDQKLNRPEQLENYYIERLINSATSLNITPIVWQEVFENEVKIPVETVVHVWKDWVDYMKTLSDVTAAGYTAILSSCWYLDHLQTGGDWKRFYDCDPHFFAGSDAQRKRVLGGEACMWAEVVDATNVEQRIWPRASAAAEKLWSSANADDTSTAGRRLEEHACRMNMRGIKAQPPNGPGFCPYQLYS